MGRQVCESSLSYTIRAIFGFRNTSTSGLPNGFCLSKRFANEQVSYHGRESEGPRRPGCSRFSAPRPLFAWRLFRALRLVESFNPLPRDPVLGVSRMSPPQSSGELGWRRRVGGWASLGAPARKLSSCWLPDGSIIKWDWARHDSRHSRGYGRDLVVYVG
jgi:hypothetical protein